MYPGNSFSEQIIKTTMQTNYYSTILMNQLFTLDNNLINDKGKVINVSSGLGRLSRLKKQKYATEVLSKYDTITFEQ